MFMCRHNIKFFEGTMLVKTNPPSVKAGYGSVPTVASINPGKTTRDKP